MRLWSLGKNKVLASSKYAATDNLLDSQTIHLFRALLRQATYLPDPAARQYFHQHIISRFREYHYRTILQDRRRGRRFIPLLAQRQSSLIRTARKGLALLQRANDGHARHLGKILAITYGRIGPRRYELLKTLKVPDTPTDQVSIERISDPSIQGLPYPSRQLSVLVKAQANRKLSFFSRPKRPIMEPRIPAKNAWGRPMPINRIRNMRRKWYGEILDRIMPPLPETEWMRLKGLASGETKWEGPITRRGTHKTYDFKHYIVRGTLVGGTDIKSSPHVLTPRYMRRLWTKLFAQCPLMKRNELRRSGWDILWGNVQASKATSLQSGNQTSHEMFAGVDHNGRRIL